MTLEQSLNTALGHHRAGQLAQAEQIYRGILQQHPNHPTALFLLGRLAAETGHTEPAAKLLARAAVADPRNADCLAILGEVLERLGRLAESAAAYRAAVALRPKWIEVLNNLGHVLRLLDRKPEAIDAFRAAARVRPDIAETHSNLADALRADNQLAEAAQAARTAIRLNPTLAVAHGNLGNILHASGELEAAVASHREAIRLDPRFIDAWNNLALALGALGRRDEAVAAYRQSLAITPNPSAGEINSNLGSVLLSMNRLDEAIDAYRVATRLRPDAAPAHANLAIALREVGEIDEAIASFRAAIRVERHPRDRATIHSNLLLTLYAHPGVSNEQLLAEHRDWAQQHADALTPSAPGGYRHPNSPDAARRLRVSFVSPDLRDHPLGRFMLPLLEHHDRERMHVICYSSARESDEVTRRLRAHAAEWRDVAAVTDEDLAEQIRDDAVDVLIDLALHSAGNALLAFARKPAPVQITYLAYAGTSGMEAMDYRLTDPHLDPPGGGAGAGYSERSLRLPHTYWCYAAPPDAPPVAAAPPMQSGGHVTFGCLNQFSKASAAARETWLRILQNIPNSRLILHAPPGRHRQRVADEFARGGVDAARIEWVGKLPMNEYFATWNRIDVALDPFPYNGGTTTCDALWMGVPVVTVAGQRAVARAGVSILSNVGLSELVARDGDAYVRIATELAADLPRLLDLRATMRERMSASPLMDANAFARDFQEIIRRAWREWCDGAPGDATAP